MNTAAKPLSASAIRILIAVGVTVLLAAQLFPIAVQQLFCAPSAWLSAQLLGVAMLPSVGGYLLDCPSLPMLVTLDCGGTTFFAILLALLLVTSARPPVRPGGGVPSRRPPTRPAGRPAPWASLVARPFRTPGLVLLSSLALAYLITLAANTARIVLGWYASVWAHATLPLSFHAGVHIAVGIVVFSGFLVAGVLVAQLKFNTFHFPPYTSSLNPEP